jgi:hypothetical protein
MEFFVHFMQQIAEYHANTGASSSYSKSDNRKTALINLVLYLILINTPIALPTFFTFLFIAQGRILPLYSLLAVSAITMIVLSEFLTFIQLKQIVSEENAFPHQQNTATEEEIKYKITTSFLCIVLGLIPLVHFVLCPLAIINATQGFEMTAKWDLRPKYRLTTRLFIISATIIYVIYSTAIMFTPLLLGDMGSTKVSSL